MFLFKLKIIVAYILYFPLVIFFLKSKNKQLIIEDIEEWCKNLGYNNKNLINKLIYLLYFNKTYRNLFYFRIPQIPNFLRNLICKKDPFFNLAPHRDGCFNEIEGGGLYVVQGHSIGTRIRANKIGKGCKFRQLTVVGTKGTNKPFDTPVIGRNVDFGANVVCIGKIMIGDNAIIGAGAVVVKDVPENAIVAGNPAKIIGWNK